MGSLTPYQYLIVDISSDEEEEYFEQSSPIETWPGNMFGILNLNEASTEAQKGSEKELNSSFVNMDLMNASASSFEGRTSPRKFGVDIFPERIAFNENAEMFTVENQTSQESQNSFYE